MPYHPPAAMNLTRSISEVTDYLYLSGFGPITDGVLAKLGITCVVDATNIPARERPGVDFVKVAVDDSEIAKLERHFDAVADKVEQHRVTGGRALIHCAAGISRSAALCLVYLVKHQQLSLKDAYLKVRLSRPIISPNNGFWRQMIAFERRVRGETSVVMIRGRSNRELPDVYLSAFST